jgi:hypothetical protein
MSETGNGPSRREFDSLERRVKELEEGEKGVLATRLSAVERRLAWQTTALFSAAVSLLLAALAVAVTVATRAP